jgi:hypothetical protein
VNHGFENPGKVYETLRETGVHKGQKYKSFVDTSAGVTYYSKKEAIAKGFPKDS